MSDNLPIDIQENIIKRLPLKPLIQCRSVSKTWKSLIGSPRFISEYNARNKHQLQHHRLVMYDPHYHIFERRYVSVVDDDKDTFPNQKISVTKHPLVNMLISPALIGSSHGLVCVYGLYRDGGGDVRTMAVIWNISIRKAVAVVLPNEKQRMYATFEGFGACRETNDLKIVKISRQIKNPKDVESVTRTPYQVEVFTLSTGAWRSPCSTSNLLRRSITLGRRQGLEGFCYWLATDMSVVDAEHESYNLIVSFDLTSEEFTEISLPDDLVNRSRGLRISNLRESLVMLVFDESELVYDVWRMEDGVPKSFTIVFTICAPDATIHSVLRFRKSGEPIIEISEHDRDPCDASVSVVVYEPNSKHISSFGFDGIDFCVYPYKETLLLLDQPEFTVYDNGKSYIAKNGSLLKHTCEA